MKDRQPDSRRAEWVLALSLACVTAGILAAGYFYFSGHEKAYRSQVDQALLSIADLKVAETAQWRQERVADGALLFHNTAFSSLARRAPPLSSIVLRRIPDVIRSGEITFQDFYRNEHDGRVELAVMVPVIDESGAGCRS